MKPDPGKARDKARLAEKKAKKKAQKEAKKEPPTSAAATKELERNLRTRRGNNRRAAFDSLVAARDLEHALAVTIEIAREAEGKNLEDLGALLLARAGERFLAPVLAGDYGELPVWELAPHLVEAGIAELRLNLHAARDVPTRLRMLGVLPLQAPARAVRELGLLLGQILDGGQHAALAASIVEMLTDVDAGTLWQRRELLDRPIAALAGLACGGFNGEEEDVAAFLSWLRTLSVDERHRRIMQARLPASAMVLPLPLRLPLLRAAYADEQLPILAAGEIARELWRHEGPAARDLILTRPDADFGVTVRALDGLDFDEAWSIVRPFFRERSAVRDLFRSSAHARDARVLDDVVQVLVSDPFGAMSYLAINGSPRAEEEVVAAFSVCSSAEAAQLLAGLTARSVDERQRDQARSSTLEQVCARLERGWRGDLVLEVISSVLPGRFGPAVDEALRRGVARISVIRIG